jgi:hypothetical protein
MIHIGRAGVNLGSFSEFEVRQGLATGRFLLTDLGWKEGMENWTPLSHFEEFATPPPPMPPLPGSELAELPGAPAAEAGERVGLPWDHRGQIGFFAAFAETVWLVLFNPGEAFARMRTSGGLADPLLYNLVGGWFGAICAGIYLVIMTRLQPPPAGATGMRALFPFTPEAAMQELKIFIFMGPVIVTVTTMIFAGIAHLFLMLAGGANKSFMVTLRVFCFSYGSAQLLQIIPFCGNLMGGIWMLVCCMIGLAVAHGTSMGRSVAAVALFFFACFLCCAGLLVLATGAAYK